MTEELEEEMKKLKRDMENLKTQLRDEITEKKEELEEVVNEGILKCGWGINPNLLTLLQDYVLEQT